MANPPKLLEYPSNGLSTAEAERLYLLLEECGEVIQAVGKILRHGYDSFHPNGMDDNRTHLEKELGDVRYAMVLLCQARDLDKDEIHRFARLKADKVRTYLHHQREELLDQAEKHAG